MAVIYNNSITQIKAIGILLMVFGHCGCSYSWMTNLVYMVHMPIFFFASGFCLKEDYIETPYNYIKRRVRGLWWPFVKWGTIFLLLHNLFCHISIYNELFSGSHLIDHVYSIKEIIIRLAGIVTFQYCEPLLGGYWFLGALFFGSIIGFCIIKFVGNVFWGGVILIVGNLLVNVLQENIGILGYTYLSQYLLAAVFFYLGWSFKVKELTPFKLTSQLVSLLVLIVGSFIWLISMGGHYYNTWKIVPYIVSATIGVWSLYSLFALNNLKISNRIKAFLDFVGNNTLPILTWHFLSFKLVSLIVIMIYSLPIETLASHPVIPIHAAKGWWIVYFIAGVFIPVSFCMISNKYLKKK